MWYCCGWRWNVCLIMNRVSTVRGIRVIFSHRIICTTVLCSVFHKTCLWSWWSQCCGNCFEENRADIFGNTAQIFFCSTFSTRCWGNSALFRTTVAVRNCAEAHCPPPQGNAAWSKFPPSDLSDICYCLLLLRSLSCSYLKLLYDRFFLAGCFLFTIKKPTDRYMGTSVLWNHS